jgi:hypothetical protein
MARAPALRDVRGELERQPHDPFEVDPIRALDALSAVWGSAYATGIDFTGRWWALRRDGLPGVSGNGPDDLLGRIKADYAARPVVLP